MSEPTRDEEREAAIRRVVEAAPPLTAEQIVKLRRIFANASPDQPAPPRVEQKPQDKPPLDQLQLYTITEAAKLLGVSRSHAYRLVADGDLRTVDVAAQGSGKPKSRVRADDIAEFIARRTQGTGS